MVIFLTIFAFPIFNWDIQFLPTQLESPIIQQSLTPYHSNLVHSGQVVVLLYCRLMVLQSCTVVILQKLRYESESRIYRHIELVRSACGVMFLGFMCYRCCFVILNPNHFIDMFPFELVHFFNLISMNPIVVPRFRSSHLFSFNYVIKCKCENMRGLIPTNPIHFNSYLQGTPASLYSLGERIMCWFPFQLEFVCQSYYNKITHI